MVATNTTRKRAQRSDEKGRKLVGVRIDAWQAVALREAATARAAARGRAVVDQSEIAREALDLHPEIKKRRK